MSLLSCSHIDLTRTNLTGEFELAHSLQELFSSQFLDNLAHEAGVTPRHSRVNDFSVMFYSALQWMSVPRDKLAFTLHDFYWRYRANLGRKVNDKSCYKHLTGEKGAQLACRLMQCASAVFARYAARKMKVQNKAVYRLCDDMGVSDILEVDGSFLRVKDECQETMGIRGRKDEHGTSIKIHPAYSLKLLQFTSFEVTDSHASERKFVPYQQYHNAVFVCDRGYYSQELSRNIHYSGNHFLIRVKKNLGGYVKQEYTEHGIPSQKAINTGRQLQQITMWNNKHYADVDYVQSDGSVVRIIVVVNPEDEKKRAYYATDLPRSVISAQGLYHLYRCRWAEEIAFLGAKHGNSLKSINSADKGIVLLFLVFSLITGLFKLYLAIRSSHARGKSNCLNPKGISLAEDIPTDVAGYLCHHKKSSIYAYINAKIAVNGDEFLSEPISKSNRNLKRSFIKQVKCADHSVRKVQKSVCSLIC